MADKAAATAEATEGIQASASSAPAPPAANAGGDSDPDFDDLDDVLDQFSANAPSQASAAPSKQQSKPTPASSGPGRPETDALNLKDAPLPDGPKPGESEEEFVNRLSSEMSKIFANLPSDSAVAAQSPEEMAKMGKELEEFTRQMEEQGVKPEDLLKAILGEEEGAKIADVATAERERRASGKDESQPSSSAGADKSAPAASFDETIRQTMSRLNQSDTQAKTASQQSASKSEEDMLAEMLKALDTGAGAGGDEGISKMFLDMMHQLTQKDMLYEPMKELHDQYPAWLANNKPPKIAQDEYDRFVKQSEIVRDITRKFEAPDYKDEKDDCRQYIWDKMQEMQAQGAPPEALVKNPFPGTDFGAMPGMGGEKAGDEDGCPTQ